MTLQSVGWYRRRLRQMSAHEVASRVTDRARQRTWRRHQVIPGDPFEVGALPVRRFTATLPTPASKLVPESDVARILAAADELLAGRWRLLGVERKDMDDPDWFYDPVTGRRAPDRRYCFSINHRAEEITGNVKQIWELSRLQHVGVLALAYAVSGSDQYAEAAAHQLRSWWRANPFLSGINWTSGIEVGLRLISWAWTRRLLEGWPGAPGLFEHNDAALAQIRWHQEYLAAYRSRGSSANNHVIAEGAGQLVGALAFPWFEESAGWAAAAARLLEAELGHNTFPDGVNREMAFEYHGFVTELVLVAAVEADRAGRPLTPRAWRLTAQMMDAIAATLDEKQRPPRSGDGDDGRGFLLGPTEANRWLTILAVGRSVLSAPPWWPCTPDGAASTLLAAMARPHPSGPRPPQRPHDFPDSGMTVLRAGGTDKPEIWCRCDAGPHGFLSIAAHAHADALSVEVRHGGVDILADPGTYCYHGTPEWRSYFRSTLAHNTVEIAGQDQSESGGPFMWVRHAHTVRLAGPDGTGADPFQWSAEHDGYTILDPPAGHQRTVRLDPLERKVVITDRLQSLGPHRARIAYHLGPQVHAELVDRQVRLTWPGSGGITEHAVLLLAPQATWALARATMDPPLGWYAPAFGEKVPTSSLVGELELRGQITLVCSLRFGT